MAELNCCWRGLYGDGLCTDGMQCRERSAGTRSEQVNPRIGRLRAAAVANINFDLIYGLPYQTAAALRGGCRRKSCAEFLAPTVSRCLATRVGPERAELARAAAATLVENGYIQIGIDHFAFAHDSLALAAAEGHLHGNFQGYTSAAVRTLIGIGATSTGRTPQGYGRNAGETGAWSRAVAVEKLPIASGHALTGQDQLRAEVIERIMCDGSLDLAAAGRGPGFAGD